MKGFSLLNSKQQQMLVALFLVILAFVGLTYFITNEKGTAAARGTNIAKSITRLANDVNTNSSLYAMLENNKGAYEEINLLRGFDKDVYPQYFFPPKVKVVETSRPAPVITPPVTEVTPEGPKHPNNVNFILITNLGQYAYIDNKRVSIGDTAPSGMKVIKIEDKRVLLEGKRSSEWVILKF